jgi:DNA-directed RNA polymerase III subunit RPC3-like protein
MLQFSVVTVPSVLCRKYLEEKQVASEALIPPKTARALLYKMMFDGFVHSQDIPKSAEHAPNKSVYLFTGPYNWA